MNIIIVGCGRVGARLASRLAAQGHNVTILDESREAFLRLGTDFSGISIQGSGLEVEILERAGTRNAEVVIALTGGHKFGVSRVVARLHDPVRAATFHEMGIETLCTTTVIEGLLECYVRNNDFPTLPCEVPVYGDASELSAL